MPFESDKNVTIFIRGDISDFKAKIAEVQKLVDTLAKVKPIKQVLPKGASKEIAATAKQVDSLEKELKQTNKTVQDSDKGFSSFQASIITANQAVGLLSAGLGAVSAALQRATRVEGLAISFGNLQSSAGEATGALERLRSATAGLIDNARLYEAANNAVVLGVDDGTQKFTELANAAVILGRATGRDAANALNDLSFGIGRQSRLILDNLGIVVRAEQAYKDFAAANNVAVDSLDESQKKIIFNEAAFKAIREAVANLADIEETAAVAFERLGAASTNLSDAFALGVSSSTELGKSINSTATFLDESNESFRLLGTLVGETASIFVDVFNVALATTLESLNNVIKSAKLLALAVNSIGEGGFPGLTKLNSELKQIEENEGITRFGKKFNEARKTLAEDLNILSSDFKLTEDNIRIVNKAFTELSESVSQVGFSKAREDFKKLRDRIIELKKEFKSSTSSIDTSSKKLQSAIESLSNSLTKSAAQVDPQSNPLIAAMLEIESQSDGTAEATAKANEELTKFIRLNLTAANLPVIQTGVGIINRSRSEQAKTQEQIDELVRSTKNFTTASPSFENALERLEKKYATGQISGDKYKETLTGLGQFFAESKAPENAEAVANSLENLNNVTSGRGLAGVFADSDIKLVADLAQGFNKFDASVEGALSGSLADLAGFGFDLLSEQLLTGDISASSEELGAAIGSLVGGIIGSFFGPIGAAIGSALGAVVGEAFGGIEGSRDLATKFAQDLSGFVEFVGPQISKIIGSEVFGIDTDNLQAQIIQLLVGGDIQGEIRKNVQDFFNDLAGEIEFQGRLFGKGGLFESSEFIGDAFNAFELPDGTLTTPIEARIAEFDIPEGTLNLFKDLGIAFAELLGVAEEFEGVAGQIGLILASELRDPQGLNELQILLKANGITAEDFGKSLEEAFLKGDVSARTFLSTVASANELLAPGIPGVEGGVDLAFDNLIDRGLVNGREAQDALQDIAIESQELGISFEELGDTLINTFGIPTEEVEKFLATLESLDITSFDQLANIDVTQTAQFITGLEDVGFAFSDVGLEAEQLGLEVDKVTEKIELLQEQAGKETTLNVKVRVDTSEYDDFVEATSGGEGPNTTTDTPTSNPEA